MNTTTGTPYSKGRHGAAATAVIGVVGVLILGAVAFVGRDASSDSMTSGQAQDPCAHLGESSGHEAYYGYEGYTRSVSQTVGVANEIARVQIAEIGEPRFETSDGDPPPPLPTNATHEDLEAYENAVVSPVTLSAQQIYSGTEVTGYVVIRWGGVTAACPGYEYSPRPQTMTGDVGDIGMIFLNEIPEELMTSPPGWLTHLIAKADALNQSGGNYKVMGFSTWYLYDGQQATHSKFEENIVSISQLESEVEAATSP